MTSLSCMSWFGWHASTGLSRTHLLRLNMCCTLCNVLHSFNSVSALTALVLHESLHFAEIIYTAKEYLTAGNFTFQFLMLYSLCSIVAHNGWSTFRPGFLNRWPGGLYWFSLSHCSNQHSSLVFIKQINSETQSRRYFPTTFLCQPSLQKYCATWSTLRLSLLLHTNNEFLIIFLVNSLDAK